VLSKSDVIDLVRERLWPGYLRQRAEVDRIDRWYRWDQDDITLPREATAELKELAKLSKTRWLGLVVTTVAQCLYVDGWRTPLAEPGEPSNPWRTWHANYFDHRQTAVYRAALAHGQSFVIVLPGELLGQPMSVMRGASLRNTYAEWADPAEDDWPRHVLRVVPGATSDVHVYDAEAVYDLTVAGEGTAADIKFVRARAHDAGVCPVVRYANDLDLDGRSPGEVEPNIAAAARINKTSYDRLLTQHYSSWKVRTVAGMAEPDTAGEKERARMLLRQQDLLVAEDPDTKFGTLDETPLDGFVEAWRADIEALAAVTQTPTHALTGQLVNLSAEALAAARAALTQKVTERQKSFGRSHAQALRLAAGLADDAASAEDLMGRVTWQDMEIRSMAQAVDALGKAATMLGVPPKALWGRIPGVEKSDVDEWADLAAEADPVARLDRTLEAQARTESVLGRVPGPAA
jgi:HPt (histidine-containing phosphotransfer) domain-containing protein